MKSIIPLLAIPVLAAFVLVGCNQSTPSNSTDTQSTNSSLSDANSIPGGITNMPATNGLPGMNTNIPASTNQ
jgi:predicted small secreted protein